MHDDTQLILAATADRLSPEGRTGFVAMDEGEAMRLLEAAGLWFGPRGTLEGTGQFRQVIPYVVLVAGSRVVRYTRTTSGKEARLHGRVSVGLGGHVDLADLVLREARIDLLGTLERAAEREVSEEVGAVNVESRRWVGLLLDDATPVGRVHVGLVAIWHLRDLPDGLPEEAIGEVGTEAAADLAASPDRLETWSAMLLPHLVEASVDGGADTGPASGRRA